MTHSDAAPRKLDTRLPSSLADFMVATYYHSRAHVAFQMMFFKHARAELVDTKTSSIHGVSKDSPDTPRPSKLVISHNTLDLTVEKSKKILDAQHAKGGHPKVDHSLLASDIARSYSQFAMGIYIKEEYQFEIDTLQVNLAAIATQFATRPERKSARASSIIGTGLLGRTTGYAAIDNGIHDVFSVSNIDQINELAEEGITTLAKRHYAAAPEDQAAVEQIADAEGPLASIARLFVVR